LTYWHVEITLEGDKRYAANMPKTSPDQQVTDVIQQICHVPYPVFEDSENEYTVINTKKIIHMSIKEVTE
jgi:hypothetical protein